MLAPLRAARSLRFALLLPVFAGLFGAGCQIIDKDRMRDASTETIPWNERADWEDATLGVPY